MNGDMNKDPWVGLGLHSKVSASLVSKENITQGIFCRATSVSLLRCPVFSCVQHELLGEGDYSSRKLSSEASWCGLLGPAVS